MQTYKHTHKRANISATHLMTENVKFACRRTKVRGIPRDLFANCQDDSIFNEKRHRHAPVENHNTSDGGYVNP